MTRPALLTLLAVIALSPSATLPQTSGNEGRIASDFRRESESLKSCTQFNFGGLTGCGETLITGQPMHIALGNLAPQNGFAAGVAFVEHKNFSNEWRLNWNLDAVATGNGSWRTGAYLKAFRLSGGPIKVIHPIAAPSGNMPLPTTTTAPLYREAPLFNLYAEATSLNKLFFFGLGPGTLPAGRSIFGLTEPVIGATVIYPLAPFAGKLNLALLGEVNGRFPSLHGSSSSGAIPAIQQLYSENTAPGLLRQPATLQAGEGLRLRPSLFHDSLRLNYMGQFQQYVAPGDSRYSFRRWTVDLNHEVPLYRKTRLAAVREQNGPDSCSLSSSNTACPPVSLTQDLEGSISVRLLMIGSLAGAGSAVPFYFQPTIGGSDINGQPILPSYPDYRFRAPSLLLLRPTFEHSIWKLPVGFLFSVDEAKVGLRRDDIGFNHLQHSFTAGFTVRAGGLPVANLLFTWGGNEGHHTIASVSNTLLGGSARPSLF